MTEPPQEPSPAGEESVAAARAPSEPSHWAHAKRFFLSLGVGACVALVSIVVIWQEYRHSFGSSQLYMLDDAIFRYRVEHDGALPPSLDALPSDRRVDHWGRPYQYENLGTSYRLFTYGRDGEPGGTGLDYDLSDENPFHPDSVHTLFQFLDEPPYPGQLTGCFWTGILGFFLGLVLIRKRAWSIFLLVGLCVGTVLTAGFMAFIHIPTGH